MAFYVLASVRAFIPGLCATQLAMDNQCPIQSGMPMLTGTSPQCCQSAKANLPAEDGEKRPITPSESHCAFCNLIIGLTDPPERLVLPDPQIPEFAAELPLTIQVAQEVTRSNAPNRAPPA